MTFSEFGFSDSVLESIEAMNFKDPTPIQKLAIPEILNDKDIIACAQTGTGKTAAFILPLLEKAIKAKSQTVDTLVIVPTRELALQIDQQLEGMGYFTGISSMAIYGGGDGISWEAQKAALSRGTNIVIATPGKILSYLILDHQWTKSIRHLVLDEADRMLDMGFNEDILRILKFLPSERQSIMFSATMPPKIRQLASKLLKHPVEINLAISKPAAGIDQKAAVLYENQKLPLLMELLQERNIRSAIIFASTKQKVKDIEQQMKKLKLNVNAIHSDLDQKQREEVLLSFRNKNLKLLVATDIVARGIDIDSIDLVVNYDVPGDAEDYVHRVGRTARAATKGEAITLISKEDQRKFASIERLIEFIVPKITVPENLGETPVYQPLERSSSSHPAKKSFNKNKGKRPFKRRNQVQNK
ncbi:MAG: DEAD/DEAH box helicase [Flavobacteriales bacterium]